MRRSPETEVLISLYQIRHASIAEIAEAYRLTPGAVYARLWRAGAIPRDSQAMYHTDPEIVAAYQELGSMTQTAETLGCTFYTVRDALGRAGLTAPRHGHEQASLRPAQVSTLVTLYLTRDLRWKELAARVRLSRGTLWVYRKRMELPA